MTSKKWLAAAVSAVSLTTIAGTSAFALQDGGVGGDGGDGGEGGGAPNLSFDTGDIDVDNTGACDENNSNDGEARTGCRGFGARGGGGRVSVRAGNGGRGGAGGGGGNAGNRTTIRRAGGGFPF
jgi:hypothetical protein